MITAYDYTMARLISASGAEMILVGDSLGMVMLGYEDTVPVTMDDMVRHTRAVSRGCGDCFLVADMPFMACRISKRDTLLASAQLMQEGRANAVKIEGGTEMADSIRAVVKSGIPVMGHVGLTPQSVHALGGFKVQGRELAGAQKVLDDARAVAEAGAFGIVLECIPAPLAKLITEETGCITIGIGAGSGCDGQVLVGQDLLGMYSERTPKFLKRYAQIGQTVTDACRQYCEEVRSGVFPDEAHSFSLDPEILKALH